MSLVFGNRIHEAVNGQGLNNLALLGPISGKAAFSDKIAVGSKVPYILLDGNGSDWETGFGTLTSASEFARTTVTDSSQSVGRINSDEAGTPIKITLSTNQHELFIGPHTGTILTIDENGDVQNPTPVRGAVYVATYAAMTAMPAPSDDETFFVKGGASAYDGNGGVFYWDDDDTTTTADGLDCFQHDTLAGRFKRIRPAYGEIDAAIADTPTTGGAALKMFFRKKATASTAWGRWIADYVSSTVGRMRLGIRYAQSAAEKFFVDVYSTGDNLDRIELNEPTVLPTRTNSNGLQTRALSFLSGVSRLAMAAASAATGVAAAYWELPLTKGGYFSSVVDTIANLKAIDAAALFITGDRALVFGRSAAGDVAIPFIVQWNSSSSATADDWSVFRPSTGAAASGNGRWLRVNVDPNTAFAADDTTPSIANGSYFTTATATAVATGWIEDFDDGYEGQDFVVARGASDQKIRHDLTKIDCGGRDLTLTLKSPYARFVHRNGVFRLVATFGDPLLRSILRGSTLLSETGFPSTTTPAGWALTGWTVNSGLVSPAAGGWTKIAVHDYDSNSNRRTILGEFTLASLSAVFGVVFDYVGSVNGTALIVDAPNNQLKLYKYQSGSTGTLLDTRALGFSLATGVRYQIELERREGQTFYSLRDLKNQVTVGPFAWDTFFSSATSWGKAGAIFISGSGGAGDVTFNWMRHQHNVQSHPFAVIIGDSNCENSFGNWGRNVWEQLEKTRNRGDIINMGRTGETSTTFLARATLDLWALRPTYAIWTLGTNDTGDTTTWSTNVTNFVADCKARGIIPVLATILPKTGAGSAVGTMNTAIRGYTFGRDVRFIDFNSAVADSHNSTSVIATAMDSGDGIHVNPTGHDALFAQVQVEAPYLLQSADRKWEAPEAWASCLDGGEMSNNGSDATNDIDFTACTRLDSTKRVLLFGKAMTKQLDAVWAAGSNAGGRDPNYSLADGTWHVHLIGDDLGQYGDYLFSQSLTPAIPAPHKYRRYLGSFVRASGAIRGFTQIGDYFELVSPGLLQYTVNNPGTSAVTVTLANVPTGIRVKAKVTAAILDTTPAAATYGLLTALATADQAPSAIGPYQLLVPAAGATVPAAASLCTDILTDTAQGIRARLSASNTDITLNISAQGYEINRANIF